MVGSDFILQKYGLCNEVLHTPLGVLAVGGVGIEMVAVFEKYQHFKPFRRKLLRHYKRSSRGRQALGLYL